MSEQVFQERHTCLVDCGLPAEQCACYMAEYELTHVDKADAWDAIVEKSREITNLRAALADAQAVGFAAGVEAAAKWISDQAVALRNHAKAHEPMTTKSDPPLTLVAAMANANMVRDLYRDADKYETHAKVIRALTPPDLTAAAARVLLGVWPTDDSFRAAFDACAASYHGGDQMQDVMDRTRATVFAALRAIAGDTP